MGYIQSTCAFCGAPVTRRSFASTGHVKIHFCNFDCKAQYQRLAKPVSKEWLYEQYVTLGKDCTQIGQDVHRDSHSVWNWLKDFGIPTRPRGVNWGKNLRRGWKVGTRHTAESRKKMSDTAKATGRVPYDPEVGSYMKGRKGAAHPQWKGGITPERQAFYASPEWAKAFKAVYARDGKTCQRCGKKKGWRDDFDIHHIVSFACKELRADIDNLVLLCEPCHYWVHGKQNTSRLFLKGQES